MTSLRDDMDSLAHQTWSRIVSGDRRDIRQGEDTITQLNLLDLDIGHPYLGVQRFTGHEERKNGADWQWLIGSDTRGWFGLRIQAKRVDGDEYRQLGHEGAPGDDYQYDTLIRSAGEMSTELGVQHFAHYVFYNGFETGWPAGVPWYGCPNGEPLDRCGHIRTVEDLGCGTTPAELVRLVHRGRGVAGRRVGEHLPIQLPWSWLFGAWTSSVFVIPSLELEWALTPSVNVAWQWQLIQQEAVRRTRETWSAEPTGTGAGIAQAFFGAASELSLGETPTDLRLADNLPSYARSVLNGDGDLDVVMRAAVSEYPSLRSLDGVVVLAIPDDDQS